MSFSGKSQSDNDKRLWRIVQHYVAKAVAAFDLSAVQAIGPETLRRLGVRSSFCRPRVSNDNAYAESLFRTCKYRPDYPVNGFATIEDAREWVLSFSRWYNTGHKHSDIKFTTPDQRHTGEPTAILEHRQQVYREAKARHPKRWSGEIRNWELPEQVWLNPEKEQSELNQAA